MNRKNLYGAVDVNNESEGDVAYCQNCERVGVKVKLQEPIYEEGKPYDPDNWCQCHRCFKKYPLYERKDEGDYTWPFAHVDNPFDDGSQFENIGKRKPKNRLHDDKDEDE